MIAAAASAAAVVVVVAAAALRDVTLVQPETQSDADRARSSVACRSSVTYTGATRPLLVGTVTA